MINQGSAMPGDANANYISHAAQVPLYELLRGIPKGLQVGIQIKDSDGTVYGHHHLPIGHHCHEAANLLQRWEGGLKRNADRMDRAIKELRDMIDGGEELRGHDSQISAIIRILEGAQ